MTGLGLFTDLFTRWSNTNEPLASPDGHASWRGQQPFSHAVAGQWFVVD